MAQLRLVSNRGEGPRDQALSRRLGFGSASETGNLQHLTAEPEALGISLWWLSRVRLDSDPGAFHLILCGLCPRPSLPVLHLPLPSEPAFGKQLPVWRGPLHCPCEPLPSASAELPSLLSGRQGPDSLQSGGMGGCGRGHAGWPQGSGSV